MRGPIESRQVILNYAKRVNYEVVGTTEACGRVAVEDAVSNRDLPAMDNSAMDGYVIRWADYEKGIRQFHVKGTIKAGDDVTNLSIGENECYKIMTGAFIPPGGDTVAEFEICEEADEYITINGKMKFSNHIRKAGEDIKKGDVIAISGKVITPFILARLVSAGVTFLKVARKLKVGIISTGSELVYPTDTSYPEKTIDSNGIFAKWFLKNFSVEVDYLGIFKDDDDSLCNFLKDLDGKYDILLSSAGISTGDYDVVANIAKEVGIEWIVRGVKQKPGKPLSFGLLKNTPFFAMPGNPVSSMFCLCFYVEPFIKKMLGYKEIFTACIEAELKGKMKKRNDRVHFNRVILKFEDGKFVAYPFESQDSHLIGSVVQSNAFCMLPSELIGDITEGTKLKVFPYEYESIF